MHWVVLTRIKGDGSPMGEVYVNLDQVQTLTVWPSGGTSVGFGGYDLLVKESPLQILQARRVTP